MLGGADPAGVREGEDVVLLWLFEVDDFFDENTCSLLVERKLANFGSAAECKKSSSFAGDFVGCLFVFLRGDVICCVDSSGLLERF